MEPGPRCCSSSFILGDRKCCQESVITWRFHLCWVPLYIQHNLAVLRGNSPWIIPLVVVKKGGQAWPVYHYSLLSSTSVEWPHPNDGSDVGTAARLCRMYYICRSLLFDKRVTYQIRYLKSNNFIYNICVQDSIHHYYNKHISKMCSNYLCTVSQGWYLA